MKSQSSFKKGLLVVVGLLVATGIFLAGLLTAQQLYNPARIGDSGAGASNLDNISDLEGSCQPICNQRGTLTVYQSTDHVSGRVHIRNREGQGLSHRAAMHAICQQEDPESHFCSIQEIEHAWRTSGVYFHIPSDRYDNLTNYSWVDDAKLGSILDSYHEDPNQKAKSDWWGGNGEDDYPLNCYAWSEDDPGLKGLALSIDVATVEPQDCEFEIAVTCCK
jgi:hypothetical protein